MRTRESKLQEACVNWFRYQYPQYRELLFAVPNGGWRNKTVAAILKAEGVVPGVSDLILLKSNGQYHSLCIEMKTPVGRQSERQKAWQRQAEAEGNKYVVCHSFEAFMNTVNNYLI